MRSKKELDFIFSEIEKRGLQFLLQGSSRKKYEEFLRRKQKVLYNDGRNS